jgi:hypothetical protein
VLANRNASGERLKENLLQASRAAFLNETRIGTYSSKMIRLTAEATVTTPSVLWDRQSEITSAVIPWFLSNRDLIVSALSERNEGNATMKCNSHDKLVTTPLEVSILRRTVTCEGHCCCVLHGGAVYLFSALDALLCHAVDHCVCLTLEGVFLRGILLSVMDSHRHMYFLLWALLCHRHCERSSPQPYRTLAFLRSLGNIYDECSADPDRARYHWSSLLDDLNSVRMLWRKYADKDVPIGERLEHIPVTEYQQLRSRKCDCGSRNWQKVDPRMDGPKAVMSMRKCGFFDGYCRYYTSVELDEFDIAVAKAKAEHDKWLNGEDEAHERSAKRRKQDRKASRKRKC